MYQINIHNSITELNKELWDSLTENNIFMCYEYLKTFEETTAIPLTPYYITVNDKAKIVAASVYYLEQKNNARIIDKILLGRFHKYMPIKISFLPVLICNRQRGDGTHFIFSPEIEQDQIILLQNKILDEIELIAKNNKTSLCFLNLTNDQKQLMNNLESRGYFKTLDLPLNFIDIQWSTFQEYKQYLSRKYPYMKKRIRNEVNRSKKAGVVIKQLQNIDGYQDRLLELLKLNHFKYNTSLFPLKQNYIKQIKENFGDNATIYAAIKEGVVIGLSVVLQKGKEAFFSSLGVDHERSQNDLTFFNIAYYEPIKKLAESVVHRIYFGRGLYESKIKRGCIIKDMFVFYKPQRNLIDPVLRLLFAFHLQWMMRKIAKIKKLL